MFDFAPTPNIPEPEVVAYKKNPDGTLRLTVNAVWAEKCLEQAFCHEVTVRPLEDGSFQYVADTPHIVPVQLPALFLQRFHPDCRLAGRTVITGHIVLPEK